MKLATGNTYKVSSPKQLDGKHYINGGNCRWTFGIQDKFKPARVHVRVINNNLANEDSCSDYTKIEPRNADVKTVKKLCGSKFINDSWTAEYLTASFRSDANLVSTGTDLLISSKIQLTTCEQFINFFRYFFLC